MQKSAAFHDYYVCVCRYLCTYVRGLHVHMRTQAGSSTLPTSPTQPGQQQHRVLLLAHGSRQVYLADLRRVLLDLQLWTDVGWELGSATNQLI